MAVTLNGRAFEHAKTLVNDGGFVYDDRDAWSEHQPSAAEENHFIEEHGFDEYARWYLGVDDEAESRCTTPAVGAPAPPALRVDRHRMATDEVLDTYRGKRDSP